MDPNQILQVSRFPNKLQATLINISAYVHKHSYMIVWTYIILMLYSPTYKYLDIDKVNIILVIYQRLLKADWTDKSDNFSDIDQCPAVVASLSLFACHWLCLTPFSCFLVFAYWFCDLDCLPCCLLFLVF